MNMFGPAPGARGGAAPNSAMPFNPFANPNLFAAQPGATGAQPFAAGLPNGFGSQPGAAGAQPNMFANMFAQPNMFFQPNPIGGQNPQDPQQNQYYQNMMSAYPPESLDASLSLRQLCGPLDKLCESFQQLLCTVLGPLPMLHHFLDTLSLPLEPFGLTFLAQMQQQLLNDPNAMAQAIQELNALTGANTANLNQAGVQPAVPAAGSPGSASPAQQDPWRGFAPLGTSMQAPEERYAAQLSQLNDMGFQERDKNIQALQKSNGNVDRAVEIILSEL